MNAVTPEYFATLGTRILRGRAFTAADDASARPVVIVDQGLAAAEWPGQDPLGRCAYIGSRQDCAGNRRSHRDRGARHFSTACEENSSCRRHRRRRISYTPFRARCSSESGAPLREMIPTIVAVLQSVVPEVPKANVRPLLDLADEGTKSWRLGARLFSLFGVAAVIMAGVGLYAALALMVRQRTTEIAVRMVLGATPGTVIGMVMRHVARCWRPAGCSAWC